MYTNSNNESPAGDRSVAAQINRQYPGGPYYLHRFATEQTITINTAAIGGNASLLAIDPE